MPRLIGVCGKEGSVSVRRPFSRATGGAEGQVDRASPALAGRTGQTNCEDSQSGIATISKPVHSILKWQERNQHKWSTIWLQKAGSVYDLIAKIWPESGPVYDLTAIDKLREKRSAGLLRLRSPLSRGQGSRNEPLSARRKLLATVLKKAPENIRLSKELQGTNDELLRVAQQFGLEGLVAKRTNSVYESGRRSGAWVKVKVTKIQDFIIGSY